VSADVFSLLIYGFLIFAVASGGLITSMLIGRRRRGFIKEEPYESGVPQIGETRTEFNVRFFLLALIFVLFDIEVLLLAPFAVTMLTDIEAGKGFEYGVVAAIFVAVLGFALLYEWRKGVLDWSVPLGVSPESVRQKKAEAARENQKAA
jgi:NADH-quinone oxidoreductase subunit A